MLKIKPKQTSFHTVLYNKIPDNHILKIIDKTVDFSFINDLLKDSYCMRMGRPAKEPELMCKLHFLKYIYDHSDVKLIEEARLNLGYLYFLHLNPEDELPDESLLCKFRTQRIDNCQLDEIIIEIVRQCIEEGIISGDSISIDSTHIEANTIKKTPERLMKHLARKIIKTHRSVDDDFESSYEEPDYKSIEDHKEAKETMKDYLENVIEEVQWQESVGFAPSEDIIKKAQEILEDPKFMQQRGVRSLIDGDARVGCKAKGKYFFGYKDEFIMTTEENIITAVCVHHGAYTDGSEVKKLLDNTRKSGYEIKEFYGDKAYFRKHILDEVDNIGGKAFIPVSNSVYRMDETKYSYNKDSDEWSCHRGNVTERKKYYKNKATEKTAEREGYKYYFPKEVCQNCTDFKECICKSRKSKILDMGLNTNEFYEISQQQKSSVFIEKYKSRASIESKNAEQKRFHGLNKAKGNCLESVSKQAKFTAIAVNLKRIAKIIVKKKAKSGAMQSQLLINLIVKTCVCSIAFIEVIFRKKIAL